MNDKTIYFEPGASARLGGYAWEETAGTLRAGQDSGDCMPTVATPFREMAHPQNLEDAQNWEHAEVNDTLNAFDQGETRTPTLVLESNQNHAQVIEDRAPSLPASMGEGGGYTPMVMSVESNQSDARMKIREDGTVQTLLGRMGTGGNNIPLAMNWDESQTSPTLTKNNAGGAQRMPDKENFNAVLAVDGYNQSAGDVTKSLSSAATDSDHVPIAANQYIVRRLTPTECELLQGFPRGWTDIGEWVDSKGKKRQTTDSARYKALGNSIAVGYANDQRGFWMWLMKRISAQYERTATLGSLFDGISGFPLAWATYNGVKNCLWSSEIEEFCIAVCKKHFGDGETEGDVNEYLYGGKG